MGKTHLAPGFRFHPTDVELVRYYLKRKVLGKKLIVDAIAEVDIYKFEPSDLPDMSYIKGGDLKWHFFCPRERKYSSGARINRATECGYWKTTGKERPVLSNSEVVGKIKTLVYHFGKSPKGERTDWVMHEYRLEDKVLTQKNIPQDTYVVCVLFKKDGPGPRNGAQYGAPFKEEDWSDEDVCADVPVINNTANHSKPNNETSLAVTIADERNKDCFGGLISESCVSTIIPTTIPELPNPYDPVITTPISSNNMDWFSGLIPESPITTTISELPHLSYVANTPISASLQTTPMSTSLLHTTPMTSSLQITPMSTSLLQTTPMSSSLQTPMSTGLLETTPMSTASLQTRPCNNNEDIYSMLDLFDNDEEVLGFSNNEIYAMLDHFYEEEEDGLGFNSQSHFDFNASTNNNDPYGPNK